MSKDSERELQRAREDDVLKRMLSTPPVPHKPPTAKKPKAKKKKPA